MKVDKNYQECGRHEQFSRQGINEDKIIFANADSVIE